MHSFKVPLLACVLLVLATSCGGGNEEAAPLDLGGGLSMTADGAILGTTDRPAGQRAVEDVH